MHPSARIVRLAANDTHALRRSVLRDGTASDVVEFDGDDEPATFHLGVAVDDEVVAISSWMRRPLDDEPAAYQLRGMATAPAVGSTGVGSRLLRAGFDECKSRGATIVWARARITARDFYVRHGFEVIGDEFVDATTGLPHVLIRRPL